MGTCLGGEPRRGVVSPVGIEPTTNWLKANCSTTELRARAQRVVTIRTASGPVNHGAEERNGRAQYCPSARQFVDRRPSRRVSAHGASGHVTARAELRGAKRRASFSGRLTAADTAHPPVAGRSRAF